MTLRAQKFDRCANLRLPLPCWQTDWLDRDRYGSTSCRRTVAGRAKLLLSRLPEWTLSGTSGSAGASPSRRNPLSVYLSPHPGPLRYGEAFTVGRVASGREGDEFQQFTIQERDQ